ncbi:MAG TPA: peptidoglycan-binding protein [Propylenella sp.]
MDDLLEARFDEQGRLAQIGHGSRQRVAERLEPRPPAMSADELERAVQKLSEGLMAIERQGRASRAPRHPDDRAPARDADFVTYSLDRLEARLEALSDRLKQRAATPPAPAAPEPPRADPTFAVDPQAALAHAGDDRRAEADAVAEALGRSEIDEDGRAADEASEAGRRAEARRQAEADAALHRAEAAARAEADAAAAEMMRRFSRIEVRIEALQKRCDHNQIEPVRAELLELLRQVQDIDRDGRSVADALDQVGGRLDEVEVKVTAARNMAANRLGDIQDRLAGLSERLSEVEVEIPGFDAIRENQGAILERFDRMEGLVQQLSSPETLLDRVDDLKQSLATAASQSEVARVEERIEQLAGRLESLPAELSSDAVMERIERQLEALSSEFAEARRQGVAAAADLDERLTDLSGELAATGEAGLKRNLSGLEERLSEIGSFLDEDRRFSSDALVRLDARLAALAEAVEQREDAIAAEALASLTGKIDVLSAVMEAQDAGSTRRGIELIDRRLGQMAASLAEQTDRLAQPQLTPLEERLDVMQAQLAELAHRAQESTVHLGPFAQKLEEIAERVSALGAVGATEPLSTRLAAIEERLAAIAAKHDPRSLHTQLEGVVSRLELLKGRSIEPGRLKELFDRVENAVRALPPGDRFDRLEQQLMQRAHSVIGDDRFERLERTVAEAALGGVSEQRLALFEKRIASAAPAAISEERFAKLERKLDDVAAAYAAAAHADDDIISIDEIAELRSDIVALRRELRSLPGLGDGEANLGHVLRTLADRLDRLPESPPATAADLEQQIQRLASLLDDPSHSRLALAHIEKSLKGIEERLDDARHSYHFQAPQEDRSDAVDDEADAVARLARSLSGDVTALKSSAEVSDKKTADSLEAVQDTLEAVVKRMAFLEQEADLALEGERRPPEARPLEPPPAGRAASDFRLPLGPLAGGAQQAAGPQEPRDASPSGLLGRLTSRQLLRRATGGRAESFSPDLDDSEDTVDLPLEPGTDSPLSSALAGAPSSDTARMSGSRGGGRAVAKDSAFAAADMDEGLGELSADDDFLKAARRAARAAAAEADEEDAAVHRKGFAGLRRSGSTRQRILLASVLAIATAVAAVQIIRNQMASETEVTAGPDAARPAADASVPPETAATAPVAPSPVASQPERPAQATAPAAAENAAAPQRPELSDAEPAPAPPADEPRQTAAAEVEGPDAPVASGAELPEPASPGTAAQPGAGQDVAALPPAASAPAMDDADEIALPEAIGPDRLRAAAISGDPLAAFDVAARFAEGRGVPPDMSAAVTWYTRAAERGLAPAQYRLGSIYEKGLGVPKDAAKAQEWYARATEAGNVKAMHNLAVLHAEGAGGAPDLEHAAQLFRQAAERGVRDSQFNLAILHARGLGVQPDLIEAYKWFAIAASSGDEESLRRRDIVAAALSESDLEKAKAAAAAFRTLPLIIEANEMMLPENGWGEDTSSVEVRTDNDLVALVQKLLSDRGFDPGPADGLLGRQTIEAITRFREQAGLPAKGLIDNGLVAALQERST